MKKIFPLVLIFCILLSTGSAFAAAPKDEFQANMKKALERGLKNIVGSPLEIPITIQEYHEGPGLAFFRQFTGFVDGTGQMLTRACSGLYDMVAAFVPGQQEGLPVEPETLF